MFYWFTPHYLWRKTFYLKEICDGGLCEVAKSSKDEACSSLVVLKCVSLPICVVCLYSHRVKSLSTNPFHFLCDVNHTVTKVIGIEGIKLQGRAEQS